MKRAPLLFIALSLFGCGEPPSFSVLCDRYDAECSDVTDEAVAECYDNAAQYDALFVDTECEDAYAAWLGCLEDVPDLCDGSAANDACHEEQDVAHDCNDARN